MTLKVVQLDDKYTLKKGRVFITGTQALVRLPMTQHLRDAQAGKSTAGYITGYRGSPLGALDDQLDKAKKFLNEHNVIFQPGVNEDLAATAVWGSQQAEASGEGQYDGVFSIWYGKGPGVDRTGDAFRHGNLAGSSKHGGVLVLMGDDHTCESSTTCHQSEFAMVDAMIPVLSPSGVQEILDYGVLGWALSRYSGCWVGMKCVKDTVEATASIDVDVDRVKIDLPSDVDFPSDGLNLRQPDTPHAQEARLHRYKLGAVKAFARANHIDRIVMSGDAPTLGIITHGKSYLDVLQALDELNLTEEAAAKMGLRVYKVGMTWPLEPQGAVEFAQGLQKVLVVEEKRSLLEFQLKELLYGMPSAPAIVGKLDEQGDTLLQSEMALDSNQIAIAIGERLVELGHGDTQTLRARVEELRGYRAPKGVVDVLSRSFYFCSGCPHSSSTVLPEGSKAYAGIGCSWMAQAMERSTTGYTQMGAEGLSWVGEAPFSKRKHMFQNLGDGTYFHSGLLAIRAAVAAKTNITYKILYNDAVAMTGGQQHDGPLDPPTIAHQVFAEGVKRVVVVTDEPDKYPADVVWPKGTTIHHRDTINAVQTQLREIEGTTVLIYDQTCAAEKRRRRKRGTFPDPAKRIVINDLVCEGCGDCGVKSNCVSVQPLETELGRKRTIDQSSCNKDFSCVKGFCPSFVTVLGGQLRKPEKINSGDGVFPVLPEPVLPSLDKDVYSILVTGMGGTGVVTIGAILGMAAHLEGRGCGLLDMAGLAQKGGSVWSHLRFGKTPEAIKTIRIAPGGADLVLGCDMIVAGNSKSLALTHKGKTRMLVNTQETMPGDFARNADMQYPSGSLRKNITDAVGEDNAEFVQASRIAVALMGDTIAANMFMMGYAYQRGLIPISADAINKAIELNGTAQQMNKDAFLWGRRAAVDAKGVEKLLLTRKTSDKAALSPAPMKDMEQAIEWRRNFLVDYQDTAYAQRYLALVERVRKAEQASFPGQSELTHAVAKYYFKLLAIKDEYEVARLYVDSGFLDSVQQSFEGDYKLVFNMAPPFLSKPDAITGEPSKKEFGAWIMPALRLLAKMKTLRNTAFDVFGYTQERRLERKLITDYEQTIAMILEKLNSPRLPAYEKIVALASLPEDIRGYGHVREKSILQARKQQEKLLLELDSKVIQIKRAA
ncbi:indolepyruvate ferredoxin oxidoreductase family protein [Alcaligenes endophyticus]|uniref:Indolepyruvate ferredoxin oxidoreductase family protein n=1 Tax=Alcaligenes endophyticus TaxID=1929088 RepID=A0ABT8EGH1_9BURK|nr:indolepyruvate ferredoxin oxidoreductase family protein [Alcaligenes endophyticus]MCX5589982.1 indolepyruvate ferredoxin oxidoreductase family protein [Alcaligenes endophyticus]MDN4120355.1 indolepyruvate ferredoxin oxidoreductase family protein [Alcaligenes endophyticus]